MNLPNLRAMFNEVFGFTPRAVPPAPAAPAPERPPIPPGAIKVEPLELVPADDRRLRAVAKPVDYDALPVEGRREVAQLAAGMLATMYTKGGIGLAANQVGVLRRVIVLQPQGCPMRVMVNPVIVERRGHQTMWEGCLSFPGKRGLVRRSKSIKVDHLTLDGHPVSVRLSGVEAQVVQHEVDHLNGILFTEKAE